MSFRKMAIIVLKRHKLFSLFEHYAHVIQPVLVDGDMFGEFHNLRTSVSNRVTLADLHEMRFFLILMNQNLPAKYWEVAVNLSMRCSWILEIMSCWRVLSEVWDS
jgi:hypothetical protein